MTVPLDRVLERVGAYFMGQSPIHEAAHRIARALKDMDIPFAVVGALAANAHGHMRTTADVDILLTREGLERCKGEWLGRGWVERFAGSRGVRDTVCNVQIDVRIAGDFPGDGKTKPIAFPDPARLPPQSADLPVVPLDTLLELKLASGMTAPHRMQDLADVQQLIRANALPRDHAEKLHPYVRDKFIELWGYAQVQDDA